MAIDARYSASWIHKKIPRNERERISRMVRRKTINQITSQYVQLEIIRQEFIILAVDLKAFEVELSKRGNRDLIYSARGMRERFDSLSKLFYKMYEP